VVGEVGLGAEEADLHEGSGDELFGVFVEEQDGGTLEIGAFGELQFFDERSLGLAEVR
jgi:hypothetical protein